MGELNNKLLSLMAIRVLVLLSVLLPSLLGPASGSLDEWGGINSLVVAVWDLLFDPSQVEEPEGPSLPSENGDRSRNRMLQLLVSWVSVQTLVYAALLRLLKNRAFIHAHIQLLGDLLLITALIYKFGRLTANFSILYGVVIGVASFLLRRQSGLIIAAIACALFGGVVCIHHSSSIRGLWDEGGALAPPPAMDAISGEPTRISLVERMAMALQPPDRESITNVSMTYTLPIHWVGFLASAFFTSYLARDETLEKELQKSALDLAYLTELHQDVVQSISSGLVVTDLEGMTTSINGAGERILGLERSGLIGTHISTSGLFSYDEWQHVTHQSSTEVDRIELQLDRDDGSVTYLGLTLTHLKDGQGEHRGYIIIYQDLTEWRSLEEQLRVQDRMAALGQMAAGLAHEVGNPLAAISGSVQMLSRSAEGGTLQAKLLGITLKESQRLDRTVKSFLQFAKPREWSPAKMDMGKLLSDDVALLLNSSEVLPGHRIELDLKPESAIITADRDQISQLFWNLALNALQAMPEGGLLHLKGRLEGDRYRLEVRDSGKGMTDQERADLFQPFRSFFGKGTGLGMAIVYRIVEEHQGNIEVDTRLGRGTVLTVDLPVNHAPRVPADAGPPMVEEGEMKEIAS